MDLTRPNVQKAERSKAPVAPVNRHGWVIDLNLDDDEPYPRRVERVQVPARHPNKVINLIKDDDEPIPLIKSKEKVSVRHSVQVANIVSDDDEPAPVKQVTSVMDLKPDCIHPNPRE